MTLILASESASRKAMLDAAGVVYTARAAGVDETALKRDLPGVCGQDIAMVLAEAKALAVSVAAPGALVLGGDSLVDVAGRLFDKPVGRDQAAEHLTFFSGKTMMLSSAAVLARDGHVVWRTVETAKLRVRTLSAGFIDSYLHNEWPQVAGCVGVFRIEALGVNLFESIEGSHFTVLGMPLLAILGALRNAGELPA
jgi:septum formation protein